MLAYAWNALHLIPTINKLTKLKKTEYKLSMAAQACSSYYSGVQENHECKNLLFIGEYCEFKVSPSNMLSIASESKPNQTKPNPTKEIIRNNKVFCKKDAFICELM